MNIKTTYASDNYTIHVGQEILYREIGQYKQQSDSVFYIVDEQVYQLHKNLLSFIEDPILIPSGEQSKSANIYIDIVERLLERGVKRNSLIFVIGGGATGDVGGFAAATVLRGVEYIQVPTTLLAHDSAIGGKTAINSSHGKNLIGAFHRPKAVIYDLNFLKTLPESEILSGFGEVFKHALLSSQKQAQKLIEDTEGKINIDYIEPYIVEGIETKKYFVTQDEYESGARKFLNLGHTLAHALEYKYKFPHGQAVILGLYAMMNISNEYYKTKIFDLFYYYNYFKNLNYPLHYLKDMDIEEMIHLMKMDKKNQQVHYIGFILMDQHDDTHFVEITESNLRQYLSALKESV